MTSSYPFELTGLPDGGPATRAGVKAHLSYDVDDNTDDVFIDAIVAGVNAFVRGIATAVRSQGREEWHEMTTAGALMLAARLVRRRNSPDGIASFNAAGGVAYVQRTDPDVAMLLELGNQQRPAVG